ncbi:MAG: 2OG-Fe(II) oxygenase [Rhizobacter sp.]|nr:2OG-Fe(II) oxygenase [Ferruginibacter sp.]
MEKIFNTLLDSFIENKVGIAEHFLNDALAKALKANLIALFGDNKLQAAGTGNNAKTGYDASFRGDHIYWLDRSHNNVHENSFFDLMDSFVKYLNETCYTGISSYEFHYTLYEKGTFYKKHMDRFQDNDSRKFSMIMYLNADWEEKDGGELCIHHEHSIQTISPLNGKIVFFRSDELAHEVLLANKARMSITGWLRS